MNAAKVILLSSLLHLFTAPTTFGDDAARLFYDGVRAEGSGNLETAVESYEKALDFSHSSNLHSNLANLHFKMGRYGKAVLHFRKALLLDPGNEEIKANLAFTREKAGLVPKASSVGDFYFAPENSNFWNWLTSALIWCGLIAAFFLIKSHSTKLAKGSFLLLWTVLVSLGLYASWRCQRSLGFLAREAVAIGNEEPEDANDTDPAISLRRYAGEAEANARIKPGELVRIATNKEGDLKQHVTPDGVKWYLAQSVDGTSKGWATGKELMLILE